MLPTIVFFIGLISSIGSILMYVAMCYNTATDSVYDADETLRSFHIRIFTILIVVACLMWSWLFYLLH